MRERLRSTRDRLDDVLDAVDGNDRQSTGPTISSLISAESAGGSRTIVGST
jgi:hypothetical protein